MSVPALLLATANEGKIRELRGMLTGVHLVGLNDVGIGDLDEPSDDFVTNAVAKALEASRQSGLPALADDSGLAVDALNGAPGVFSARFAGRHGDDAANRLLLQQRMANVPDGRRGARFRCVMALADHSGPLGERVPWVHGSCPGSIAMAERGVGGFGYDPLFVVGGTTHTMAELSSEEKHRISHRGQAVRAMLPMLIAYLHARQIGEGRSTWGSLPT